MDSPTDLDENVVAIKALIVTQIAIIAKLQESGSQDDVMKAIINLRNLVALITD